MNIKEVKNKIYALLGIGATEDESALFAAISSAARKIAFYAKCIKKSANLYFTAEKGGVSADLPCDFAVFAYIRRGERVWGREHFEIIGKKIKSSVLSGEAELVYYAYPPEVTEESDEETELFSDAYACDTAVYGAAMELCAAVYPTDVQKYMRIATEYDERMANMISRGGADRIANGFFSAMRGNFI